MESAKGLHLGDLRRPENRFRLGRAHFEIRNQLKYRLRPERLIDQADLGLLLADQFEEVVRTLDGSDEVHVLGFGEAAAQSLDNNRLRVACAYRDH